MSLPSDVTKQTVGVSFSAANNLYGDFVSPGFIRWSANGTEGAPIRIDQGGGIPGDIAYPCAGITLIISCTAENNGLYTD